MRQKEGAKHTKFKRIKIQTKTVEIIPITSVIITNTNVLNPRVDK